MGAVASDVFSRYKDISFELVVMKETTTGLWLVATSKKNEMEGFGGGGGACTLPPSNHARINI